MTQWLLLHLPTWALFVLFVIVPTLAAMLGLRLVRRRFDVEVLRANNDEGGVIFTFVGTVYAVFLAFIVVVAWQNLGAADQRVTEEAAALTSLFRDASTLPPSVGPELQGEIRAYAQTVIGSEWGTMARGEESQKARMAYERIWTAFARVRPGDNREAYAEAFARLNELDRDRQLRILSSRASIPGFFWLFLLPGGLLLTGYTFLFGMRNRRVQTAMTGAIALAIGSALLMIVLLDHPFTGDIRTEPDAFVHALETMDAAAIAEAAPGAARP